MDTPYISSEEFPSLRINTEQNDFSIFHLNIRSIKKFFGNFKLFLSSLNFNFSVICFSETWLDGETLSTSRSLYELPNYKSIHQVRNYSKGGGVSIYINKSLNFKLRPDLSINSRDVESLSIEILFNKERNTLINVLYRPPKGVIEPFERFLKEILKKTKQNLKPFHIAGDFNLNILDYDKCSKVHNFLNLLYENGMIPTINKPTRVTRKTATAIDHILTNQFINVAFKTAIFKTDISDHFPVCIIISSTEKLVENKHTYVYKRVITDEATERFNQTLYETDWVEIETCDNPSECYKLFLKKFLTIYENFFPRKKIKLKLKDIQSPWITSGIKKSSKRKQRLYDKFLKTRNQKSELEYKNYKNLFETIKKRSKKLHYSKLIIKYKENIKKT